MLLSNGVTVTVSFFIKSSSLSRIRLQELALGAADGRCMSDIKRAGANDPLFINFFLISLQNILIPAL